MTKKKCLCLKFYYGDDCGIPDAIWHSRYSKGNFYKSLKRRKVPRRVINGLPLLNESALLEARLHELNDTVDVFLLAESKYSSHGDPKTVYIQPRLERGFLQEFHPKILHVLANFFPEEGRKDSWVADKFLRVYMGRRGIPRIKGIRDDDLFILNDADEVPNRAVVMFLRLYDGYAEPISLTFRWSLYGFFWKHRSKNVFTSFLGIGGERTTTVFSVATMGLVTNLMYNNPYLIRTKDKYLISPKNKTKVTEYKLAHPNMLDPWNAGASKHYAGWHCSWCFG